MSAGWMSVLSELLAPAMVVAISPFSIIAVVVLILNTDRPRPNGVAFLAGRLIALAAVTALFMQAPRLLTGFNRPIAPSVLIITGGVLLLFAVLVWVRRDRMREEPRWLAGLSRRCWRRVRPPGC
jgi:hypothetical protein